MMPLGLVPAVREDCWVGERWASFFPARPMCFPCVRCLARARLTQRSRRLLQSARWKRVVAGSQVKRAITERHSKVIPGVKQQSRSVPGQAPLPLCCSGSQGRAAAALPAALSCRDAEQMLAAPGIQKHFLSSASFRRPHGQVNLTIDHSEPRLRHKTHHRHCRVSHKVMSN